MRTHDFKLKDGGCRTKGKMLKKVLLKGLIFLLIIGAALAALSPVFIYKTEHRGKLIEGLYESDDTYDVVFMGSSHMNGGMDPNVLWKQHGITSFNYATGGQPTAVSYYLLKDVLKKHKNPIVVLDVYYAGMTSKYGSTGFISNAVDNMRFSKNKADAILSCTPPEEWINYFFPVLKYHFRWQVIEKKDFTFDPASVYYTKGFSAGTEKYGKSDKSASSTSGRIDIPSESLKYLKKFVELSKKEGFKLVFVNMPCDYTESNKEDGWVNDCAAMMNSIADFADENGVPFVDMCSKMDEIGIDFADDMNNSGHLNIWGAYKTSTYFGNYLKKNYTLKDRRSDSAYSGWDDDYKLSQVANIINP